MAGVEEEELCVFDYLSNDILCYIFQFLHPATLSACARTCYRWHEVTVEKVLWKSLYKRDWFGDKKQAHNNSFATLIAPSSSLASSSALSSSSSSPSSSPPAKKYKLDIQRPHFKRKTNFWRLLYQQKVMEKLLLLQLKHLEADIWNKLGFWAVIKVDRNISAAITTSIRVAKLRELIECIDSLAPDVIAELKRVKPNMYFILSQQSGFQNLHIYLSVNQSSKDWMDLIMHLPLPNMCAWLERLRNIDTRELEDTLRAIVKVDGDQATIQPFIDKIIADKARFVALLEPYPPKSFDVTLAGKDYSYVVHPPFCHRPPIELIQSIFVYCHECTVDAFYDFLKKEASFIFRKKTERQALERDIQVLVEELIAKLKVKDIRNQSPANIKAKKYLRTLHVLASMVDELLAINLEGIVINVGYEFYIRDGGDLYIPYGCSKERLKEYLMEAPIAEAVGDIMVTWEDEYNSGL